MFVLWRGSRQQAKHDGKISEEVAISHLVKMVRNSIEPGGRDHFSCSTGHWRLLLDIGKSFGWKSHGTRYVPGDIVVLPGNLARHGYRPGDAQDRKVVDATDALEWARALTEARNSQHLIAMIVDHHPVAVPQLKAMTEEQLSINAPFITIMDEFIEYAFSGGFEFHGS